MKKSEREREGEGERDIETKMVTERYRMIDGRGAMGGW